MQTVSLVPHPKTPPQGVRSIEVDIGFAGERLHLRYTVAHDDTLKIPARHGRLDELWRTTCFEIFVRDGEGPGYVEFNLAPVDAWAGYGFTAQRQGMHDLDIASPIVSAASEAKQFELTANFQRAALPAAIGPASLSAVIEEQDGTTSYWAIVHPKPEAFDFHDPRCFVLDLERAINGSQNPLPK